MKVETIFFDAGNTLCHLDMGVVSGILAELGCMVKPAILRHAEERARKILDTPEHFEDSTDDDRWKTYFHHVLDQAGVPSDGLADRAITLLRAHHNEHNLWSHVPADVPGILENLKARGFKMAVVSNANGTVPKKMEEFGLAPYFAAIIDSQIEGVEKPDPRIFDIALERTGARRETTIHVGDIYHIDVTGAEAAGLTAVLLDPAGVHTDKNVKRIRRLADLESLLPPA